MPSESKSLTNPWVLRILDKLRHGAMGFCALERAVETPHPVMLSSLLKKAVRDGLIERRVLVLGPPARTSYELTELGTALANAAAPLLQFVDDNLAHVITARERAQTARANQVAPYRAS